MKHIPRDDKLQEIVCRIILFALYFVLAECYSGGFTFVEGIIVWMLTGSQYDTTIILNNQRGGLE